MSLLTAVAPYVIAWYAIVQVIWMLFDRVENASSEAFKHQAAQWLSNAAVTPSLATWPAQFALAFDAVFDRPFTSRSVWRSSLVSSVSVALLCILWLNVDPGAFRYLYRKGIWTPVWYVPLTLVPGYIGMLVSRWVIGLLQRNTSLWWLLVLVTANVVLTAMATTGFVVLLFGPMIYLLNDDSTPITAIREIVSTMVTLNVDPRQHDFLWSIWIVASLFTSCWAWLYAMAAVLLKTAQGFDAGLRIVRRCLAVENKPFVSLGVVSIAIITVGFVGILFARMLTMLIAGVLS